jgi:hypothetical protein
MSARDGAVSIRDKHGDMRPAPARTTHLHGCGHFDTCFTPKTEDCQRCRTDAFNKAMAQRYREDAMTTEQLLDRRA